MPTATSAPISCPTWAAACTLSPVYQQNFFTPQSSLGTVMTRRQEGDGGRRLEPRRVRRHDVPGRRRRRGSGCTPGGPGREAKKRIGGWTNLAGYRSVTGVGDFDGDGWPDLMARSTSGRDLSVPRSRRRRPACDARPGALEHAGGLDLRDRTVGQRRCTGRGAQDPYWTAVRVSRQRPGWSRRSGHCSGLASRATTRWSYLGDVTGDGRPDLAGRNRLGDLFVLPKAAGTAARPAGTIGPRLFAGSGFQGYRLG